MPQAATGKAKRTTHARSQATTAEKELKAMKAVMADITSSKEKSFAFLREAGLITRTGRLTKPYRD